MSTVQKMTNNICLNSSESQFAKYIIDDRIDGTRITQNFSKFCENCRLIKQDLESEMFSLKDKAHQSFMQVIQVQQLHEQQMDLMKQQHSDEVTNLRQEIQKLQQLINQSKEQLLVMQKNSKHHICEFDQPSFLIENIDMIQCQEESSKSRLDQSSFVQFNDLVQGKASHAEGLGTKKKGQFFKDSCKNINEINQNEQKIQRLNYRIMQLQKQVFDLWETNQQLKKQCINQENKLKSLKNNYDELYKESKFMSDHIRILSTDKFKLQKKVKEMEKQLKQLKKSNQLKIKTPEQAFSPLKIKVNGCGLFTSQQIQPNNTNETMRSSLVFQKEQQNSNLMATSLNLQNLARADSNNYLDRYNPPKSIQRSKDDLNRKSLSTYKIVSHIPSFKKNSNQKSQTFSRQQKSLNKGEQNNGQDSNIMKDLMKEIEKKERMSKSQNINTHKSLKPFNFKQSLKKKPSYQ